MDCSSCLKLEPGKSVRPIEPAKRVSPTRAVLEGSWMREMEPGECPGVWATLKVRDWRVRVSLWLRCASGVGPVMERPRAAERLRTGSLSQDSSRGWM